MAGPLPFVLQSKLLGFVEGSNDFSVLNARVQAALIGTLPKLMFCHQLRPARVQGLLQAVY